MEDRGDVAERGGAFAVYADRRMFAQCATAGVVDTYAGLAVSPDRRQVYAGSYPRRHRRLRS